MTINSFGESNAGAVGETAASFGSRFMAFAIDVVLLGFLMALLFALTGDNFIDPLGASFSIGQYIRVFTNWIIALLFSFMASGMCYFCLMHAWCGQTVGKKIMGIRLVSQTDGELNTGRCFLRWVGYYVSAVPFFFGFFWVLLDVEGRAWHDRLAGTKVVYG